MSTCAECDASLTGRRASTRYCSPRCRTRAYRDRLAATSTHRPTGPIPEPAAPPVTVPGPPVALPTAVALHAATGCPYPRHTGREWTGPGGEPITCGICHPPARPEWAA